jgi:hypothetical protein
VGSAVAIGAVLAVLATGCAEEQPPLPPACGDGPGVVRKALAKAPGDVRLYDGTLLSDCVAKASTDAELQLVGYGLTPVADALASTSTERAATQLGFLVGAARRGGSSSNGVQAELVRRLESRVRYDEPALLAAAERAAAAGEDHG